MRSNLFWLSDEQWRQIEPHLPTDVRGKPREDDRRVISGILHMLKSGGRWSDCQEVCFGLISGQRSLARPKASTFTETTSDSYGR
jgi:transposase